MGLLSSKNQEPAPTVVEEDWHEEAEKLRQEFVDPHYNDVPLRQNTVEVASEYVGSGLMPPFGGVFPGVSKYLGGAMDERDGCIYGIPAHAKSLICLHRSSGGDTSESGCYQIRIEALPAQIANGKFKWLRGIIAHGYLYGIPAWANCVLEVDIDAMWGRRKVKEGQSIINLIPLPEGHVPRQWQWHGASLNKEQTAIYSIPSNAHKVLKVDLQTHTTSFIDIDIPASYTNFSFDHTNKWYGGILGNDNAVYGMPYRTCSVLRIDTETDSATIVGPDHGVKLFNWHGGLKSKTGMIYAFPSHSDKVLKIDTSPESKGQVSTLLDIHRADYDKDTRKNYKWLGGAYGEDGNIYSMPADASSILKIDTTTDHCSTFGFVGSDKNKWQGGVLAPDGCVYAIPANGKHVLRIDTRSASSEGENPMALIGNLPARKDKWQGMAQGTDGCFYAIPEGGYRILKLTPGERRDDAAAAIKMSEDDVKIELL